MAKKQLVDYTFDPARKLVTMTSNVLRERLILITNVTTNTIIYNFAEPTLGLTGDPVYDPSTNETTVVLIKDTTAMSATDNLQIYVEGASTTFYPDEALLDSVSKLRVSTPESLIDTDFEYGLQSTKWETLRMVNNIPSFYSRTGDTPITVSAVTTTAGQKSVIVTSANHGLTTGIPFEINGLSNSLFEGGFVITSVPDANTFAYKVPFTPTVSEQIATIYTAALPGAFYSGSSISLSSVTTNGQSPTSTITVNTVFPHGLNQGAEVYLVNTTAKKSFNFNASEATSVDITNVSVNINPSTVGENTADYRSKSIIIDDILGADEKYFGTGSVSVTADNVTITNHGFAVNEGILFYTSQGSTPPTGLANWNVYYAHANTTTNTLAFSNASGGTIIDISGVGDSNIGPFRVTKCKKVQTATTTDIGITTHGYAVGDSVIFVRPTSSTSTVTGVTLSNGNIFPGTGANQYRRYYVVNVTTNTFKVALTVGGTAISVSYTAANNGGVFVNKVVDCSEANCFYALHGLSNNDYVLYTSSGASTPLVTNTRYTVEKVNDNYFRLKDRTSGAIQNLTTIGSNTHVFGRTTTTKNRDTIRIPNLAGTLSNNQLIQYSSSGGTLIGGLTDNNYYYVKTVGFSESNTSTYTGDLASNYLRLAPANQAFPYAATRNDVNCLNLSMATNGTTVTMTTSNANFVANDVVMIYGCGNEFFNDIYRVAASPAPTATSVTLNLPTDGGALIYKNNAISQTTANSGNAIAIIDFTSNGTGTHKLNQDSSKAADDIYSIGAVTSDRSFTASASSSISIAPYSFNPTQTSIFQSGNNANHWFYIQDHKLADGVALQYGKGPTGNSQIGGLIDGTTYYAVVRDKDYFSLASTSSNALLRNIDVSPTSNGSGTSHTFTTSSVNSFLIGDGYISTTNSSITDAKYFVKGLKTKFLSSFTPGDILKFYTANVASPGTFYALEIDSVKSDTIIKLKTSAVDALFGGIPETNYTISSATWSSNVMTFTTSSNHNFVANQFVQVSGVGVTGGTLGLSGYNSTSQSNGAWQILATPLANTFTVTNVTNPGTFNSGLSNFPAVSGLLNYFVQTSLYVKSDSLTTHRPFDGGVNITSGNLPNSTIIRQTRKYFRYQPGKGIQVSLSVNFNPPFDVHRIQSSGNVATVVSRTPHYLKSTGSYQVRITDATVTTGSNPYNGTFDVASIIDDYTFTYNFITYSVTGNLTINNNTISNINDSFTGNINAIASPTNSVNSITSVSSTVITTLQIGMTITGTGIPDGTAIRSINTSAGIVYLTKSVTTTANTVTFTVSNIMNFIQAGSSITGTGIPVGTKIVDVIAATNQIVLSANATATVVGATLTLPANASTSIATGFPKYNLVNWTDAVIRAGLFDTQNGMFFEYDGQNLYCVRRSSVQQISGTCTVTNRSCSIVGDSNTRFTAQLSTGEYIVIRGQSYLITQVVNNQQLYVQPEYRGVSITNCVVSKTVDTKTPQYNWNIDVADGTGIHGYVLDANKIQMVYLDYSWYGAGKIRYGFKDANGEVRYFHQYVHNNIFTEAYFRAGNLPARYEVNTFGNPTFSPSLYHWGTSVIMDGRYDGDKAYLFTADSNTLSFTNGGALTFS